MANLKSSQKDIRRIRRRTVVNGKLRTRLKTLRKKVVSEPNDENRSAYASALDRAAKRNVIHPNKVNREKSKLAKGGLNAKTRH